MRKGIVASVLVVLALAATAPLLAGEAKVVKLQGWVVDEWCGKNNANAEGHDCALKCHSQGAALVLFSEGKLYKLTDQAAAKSQVGHKVAVEGTLEGEDTIKVAKWTKVEETKKTS